MITPSRFYCRHVGALLTALAVLPAMPLLSACGADSHAAGTAAPAPARLTSARYTFRVGQPVAITPLLTMTLERINDSRCKHGAVCVWEGYISYTFSLSKKSGASTVVLSEAMPDSAPSMVRDGLRFTLAGLAPAAPPALNAPPPDYRVTLRVDVTPSHSPSPSN